MLTLLLSIAQEGGNSGSNLSYLFEPAAKKIEQNKENSVFNERVLLLKAMCGVADQEFRQPGLFKILLSEAANEENGEKLKLCVESFDIDVIHRSFFEVLFGGSFPHNITQTELIKFYKDKYGSNTKKKKFSEELQNNPINLNNSINLNNPINQNNSINQNTQPETNINPTKTKTPSLKDYLPTLAGLSITAFIGSIFGSFASKCTSMPATVGLSIFGSFAAAATGMFTASRLHQKPFLDRSNLPYAHLGIGYAFIIANTAIGKYRSKHSVQTR